MLPFNASLLRMESRKLCEDSFDVTNIMTLTSTIITCADIYLQKLVSLIDEAQINTMTVMIMQVPCCGGLLQMAQRAGNLSLQ